jgi:Txe/YoeB family toxin of toxin-antitoxin system
MYNIQLTKQAQKDAVKVEHAGLKGKVIEIIRTVKKNPFEESQGFEFLTRDLKGSCSRRINLQNRFVYQVLPNTEELKDENGELYEGIIKILRMWTHYE